MRRRRLLHESLLTSGKSTPHYKNFSRRARMPYGDKKKQKEYQKNWHRERRANWVTSKGGRCTFCNSTKKIQVDHIDPILKPRDKNGQKPRCGSRVWSRGNNDREEELKNCQILCWECHKKKSQVDVFLILSYRIGGMTLYRTLETMLNHMGKRNGFT